MTDSVLIEDRVDFAFATGALLDELPAAARQRAAFPELVGRNVAFGHHINP
jgi:hypothetical protein